MKRHFRELSISMETPFTVAGVGDMSGMFLETACFCLKTFSWWLHLIMRIFS
ncbi:MAG: hypothetical protein H6925_03625 [Holosporaceae bacterium]|nr:MAG: hypothetical protein H6925_03625 [Holosporaceae bacterium]